MHSPRTLTHRHLKDIKHVLSHDLLGSVRQFDAFLTLFQESRDAASEELDTLGMAQKVAALLERRLKSLVELVELEGQVMASMRLALSDVVEAALEPRRDALSDESVTVEVSAEGHPQVEGDPLMLRMLVVELLDNALKFRKPNAPLTLRISLSQSAESATLTVQDDGMGFKASLIKRIFKPFKSLHPRGTYPGVGMGLTTCALIAARHEGRLEATGELGVGATFVLTLPTPGQDERA